MLDAYQGLIDGLHAYVTFEMGKVLGEEHGHGGPSSEIGQSPGGHESALGLESLAALVNVGTPDGSGFTHQTTPFTCDVVSQKMILDQFHILSPVTGAPLTEKELMYEAASRGWLDEHGTAIPHIGELLEFHGVDCHFGHDWHHLVKDLAAGHQVLIAVNADNLWSEHTSLLSLSQLLGNGPNHAIVLKGLKLNDDGRIAVVVNDPGCHDGAGVEYPLEHFEATLKLGRFDYVATNAAPPGWEGSAAVHDALGYPRGASTDRPDLPPLEEYADIICGLREEQKRELMRRI